MSNPNPLRPDYETDCHGHSLVGSDDDGIWAGTANALLVLGDERPDGDGPDLPPDPPRAFCVTGYLGPELFTAHLCASTFGRARNWALGLGATELHVMGGALVRRPRHDEPFLYLSDEEAFCAHGSHVAECRECAAAVIVVALVALRGALDAAERG